MIVLQKSLQQMLFILAQAVKSFLTYHLIITLNKAKNINKGPLKNSAAIKKSAASGRTFF